MCMVSKGNYAFTSWANATAFSWDACEQGFTVYMRKSNKSWIVTVE